MAKNGNEAVDSYSPYLEWTLDQAKETRKLLDLLAIQVSVERTTAARPSAGGVLESD